MTTTTPATTDVAKDHRTYKAFLDRLVALRYVNLYPVCWGTDPTIYRTQLRGTQATGLTCVHCDRLPGHEDHRFIPVGRVITGEASTQIFRHITCPTGGQP